LAFVEAPITVALLRSSTVFLKNALFGQCMPVERYRPHIVFPRPFLLDSVLRMCFPEVGVDGSNESRLSSVLHSGGTRLKRCRGYIDRAPSSAHAEVHDGLLNERSTFVHLRRLRLSIRSSKQWRDKKKTLSWSADKLGRLYWLMQSISLVFQLQPYPWVWYRQRSIVHSTINCIMVMR
jgi:hypothetical protein